MKQAASQVTILEMLSAHVDVLRQLYEITHAENLTLDNVMYQGANDSPDVEATQEDGEAITINVRQAKLSDQRTLKRATMKKVHKLIASTNPEIHHHQNPPESINNSGSWYTW